MLNLKLKVMKVAQYLADSFCEDEEKIRFKVVSPFQNTIELKQYFRDQSLILDYHLEAYLGKLDFMSIFQKEISVTLLKNKSFENKTGIVGVIKKSLESNLKFMSIEEALVAYCAIQENIFRFDLLEWIHMVHPEVDNGRGTYASLVIVNVGLNSRIIIDDSDEPLFTDKSVAFAFTE